MKTFIVTYLSPGTLFSEMNTKEFSCGDLELLLPTIKDYAQKITQRHGAKPYGFTIKDIEGTYYIKGTVKTFHQVVRENFGNPDTILIRNMRNNNYTHIITGDSPYKFSIPFDPLRDKLI